MKNKLILLGIITALILIVAFKEKEVVSALDVDNSFKKSDYLNKKLPVMFDLGSDTCISCRDMRKVLIDTNLKLEDKAIIKFIDVIKYPDLLDQFDMRVMPTQYFYNKDGKLYKKNEGPLTKEKIYEIFAEMGYLF